MHTAGAPTPSLVVDLDHPNAPVRPNVRKCDYLFLAEDSTGRRMWAVPLELMSTGLSPSKVESQLQAGARVGEQIVHGVSSVRFVPVAVHGNRPHRRVFQELRKRLIQFRQGRYQIMTMPCGSSLAWALE